MADKMNPMRKLTKGQAALTSIASAFLAACIQTRSADAPPANPQFDLVPGVVIDHSPQSTGLYIGSPSLAVLPDGQYMASHDFFGPNSGEHQKARSVVFRSPDRGRTWRKVSEVQGAFWSSLFVHRGALYLLGPDRHHGNVLIRRSLDKGETWTSPVDNHTGLLRNDGEYHCAPMPVIEHQGRLWRGMERRQPPAAWGVNYRAGVLSAPVDADLLDASNWTHAEFLPSDRSWNGGDMGAWLEGNAVVTPAGDLVDILRVQTKSPDEKAAIVRVSADGKTLSFDPATGFVRFPGGAKKFAIRFDPRTKLYWSLASIVHDRHRAENPGSIRNALALTCSPNLTDWAIRCILLYHPDVKRHGFQYVDWLFDGEDIIAACRTAYDDGIGGAHNAHDANFLTFHRFAGFRRLTRADSADLRQQVSAPGPANPSRPVPAAAPNVLLICVDDLKPLLGCYGSATIKSPNIDRLAGRGVLFEKAYCNQAVCAPSRNALMTGLRSTTLGIYDLGTNFRKAAPDAVTVAQRFKQHGWRTEALGKIFHVGHGNHEDPVSWSVPHWRPKLSGLGGGYALRENRPPQPTREEALFDNLPQSQAARLSRGAPVECADVPDGTYADGQIADEAIRRLRRAKDEPGKPFFLAVGFHKPHLPFVAPQRYWDLYQRASFRPPPLQTPPLGAPPFAPTSWGELRQYSDIPETGPLTGAQEQVLIHGYHAAVSYMDAQLGRVLDELDRSGLGSNTIILLWGDHGWHLGDHGMWCKHTNYEQAAHIPLLVVLPGVAKAGGRSAALVETVDIYPTLCELAGLPAPDALDGASFAAVLRDPSGAKTKEAVFHAYPRSPRGLGPLIGRAVRTDRYRLVEWKKPGAPAETAILELYDYLEDPDETKNLSNERPQVVAHLRAVLERQPEAKPQIRAGGG